LLLLAWLLNTGCADRGLSIASSTADGGSGGAVDLANPRPTRVIFVTSRPSNGDLGGPSGADASCTHAAAAAGLPGVFMAWLSDDTIAAKERVAHSSLPYVLADGEVLAANWDELINSGPRVPIHLSESRTQPEDGTAACPHAVWTDTLYDGTLAGPGLDCANWTSAGKEGGAQSAWGSWGETQHWSNECSGGSGSLTRVCESTASLYCFEQ
jgi:hypothetical protein